MPDVKLSIAGREYIVGCNPGEEPRLAALGAMVDASAQEAGGSGNLNETRTLLFSALLLADKLHDSNGGGGSAPNEDTQASIATTQSAEALEGLASRLENLALRLEN